MVNEISEKLFDISNKVKIMIMCIHNLHGFGWKIFIGGNFGKIYLTIVLCYVKLDVTAGINCTVNRSGVDKYIQLLLLKIYCRISTKSKLNYYDYY